MRSAVVGIYGTLILLAVLVCGLGIYGRVTRENYMQNGLSKAVKEILLAHYCAQPAEVSDQTVQESAITEDELQDELLRKLTNHGFRNTDIEVTSMVFDFEEGFLSVVVSEHYRTPFGEDHTKVYQKTAIVEQSCEREAEGAMLLSKEAAVKETAVKETVVKEGAASVVKTEETEIEETEIGETENEETENEEQADADEADDSYDDGLGKPDILIISVENVPIDITIYYMANRFEGDKAHLTLKTGFNKENDRHFYAPWNFPGHQFVRWVQPANDWRPYYMPGDCLVRGWKIIYAPIAVLCAQWSENSYYVNCIDEGEQVATYSLMYTDSACLPEIDKENFEGWRLNDPQGSLLEGPQASVSDMALALGLEYKNLATINLYASYRSDEEKEKSEDTEDTEDIENTEDTEDTENTENTEDSTVVIRFLDRVFYQTLDASSKWREKPKCLELLKAAGIIE